MSLRNGTNTISIQVFQSPCDLTITCHILCSQALLLSPKERIQPDLFPFGIRAGERADQSSIDNRTGFRKLLLSNNFNQTVIARQDLTNSPDPEYSHSQRNCSMGKQRQRWALTGNIRYRWGQNVGFLKGFKVLSFFPSILCAVISIFCTEQAAEQFQIHCRQK